ncbi:MAG: NADH:ubiquinone oxidoreductase [Euryarchaeota archaeon]|nr:NADH:ubiquinone oxidoreductase [Euryarchaeota archaeon]
MWMLRGLKKGVLTTRFPKGEADAPLTLRPVKMDKCPFARDEFSCLACGLCEMKESTEKIEIKDTIPLKSSIHIFVMDVGSCAACNREVSLLKAPQYDLHRLGLFFTPTPKHADVMLVLGAPTEKMVPVLKEAYELMPEPKAVVALGACANGAFGQKVEDTVPVSARISGCPPQPVEILKVLLGVAGRWNE